ncbi:MAG TPA: 16S rRNA (guanine(527)-N(7))-methyltransferase RsmG [Gammaproteobacteria bacterium]|jgi:16S rRNA (guanine527-N7)-methyltransferase|nr:16S rRNA (guanine(527)-N(7))-methyltransferase RsmG [Gammaproteobacteria bacterium]
MRDLLITALNENDIVLPEIAIDKLIHYLEIMQSWNKVFNLTSITEPREMVYLHIVDSLLTAPFLTGNKFLDVGSGAGLPGIPLAIMHPEHKWILLDKNNKKTRFMTQAIAELNLTNASAVQNRAEDFHPDACFDSILSRAYATLALFVKTTRHLICKNGTFIAMKGKYPHDELQELAGLTGEAKVFPIKMQGMTLERNIVCIKPE